MKRKTKWPIHLLGIQIILLDSNLKKNTKLERITQLIDELEAESHLFIVILGTIIGAILALLWLPY